MLIGELVRQTKVSASRIRFYETNGFIQKADRLANGYRSYPPSAIDALQFIDRAQNLGFSLQEIRAGFKGSGDMPSRSAMIEGLQKKLDHLDLHIAETAKRRTEILTLVEELRSCP